MRLSRPDQRVPIRTPQRFAAVGPAERIRCKYSRQGSWLGPDSASVRKVVLRTPLLLVISLVVVATGPSPASDQAHEQITTTVNLIQLTAVVRDRSGRPVQGLTAEDFVVKDQGRVQEIRLFEAVGVSDPQATLQGIEWDEQGTAQTQQEHPRLRRRGGAGDASQARHIIILFQPLGFHSRHYAIRAARKFLRRKAPSQDRIAIVDGRRVVQPFTDDLESCLRALDSISGRLPQSERHGYGEWYAPTIELLRELSKIPARKAMVLFTDFDLRITGFALAWWIRDAVEANVALYPVDARGLETIIPFGDASTPQPFPPDPIPLLSVFAGPIVAAETMAKLSLFAASESSLASAAAATGGRYLANNNLASIFDRMEEDFSSYYILGYYLNDLSADGKFHRIKVEVKRPGVRVLAKSGYYAPKSFSRIAEHEKAPFLYEALLTERPFHDIQAIADVRLFPDPKERKFDVAITCELQWSQAGRAADLKNRTVALMGMVWHEDSGREAGSFFDLRRWMPSKWDGAEEGRNLRTARYNMLTRLPPGEYRLKVVAADLETNMLGSGAFRFAVPKLPKEPFAISSLVLADSRLDAGGAISEENTEPPGRARGSQQGKGENPAHDPLRVGNSRLLPNPSGAFRSDDKMLLFARVYDRHRSGDKFGQQWSASAVLRDSSGTVVAGPFAVPIGKSESHSGGVPLVFPIDLRALSVTDGKFFAELELVERGTGKKLISRAAFVLDSDAAPASLAGAPSQKDGAIRQPR